MRSIAVVGLLGVWLLAVLGVAEVRADTYYGYGNPSAPPTQNSYGLQGTFTICSEPFTVSYTQQLSSVGVSYNPSASGYDSDVAMYMALTSVDSNDVHTPIAVANQGAPATFPGFTAISAPSIAYFHNANFAYSPSGFTGLLQPNAQYAACISYHATNAIAVYYNTGYSVPDEDQYDASINTFSAPFSPTITDALISVYASTLMAGGVGDPVFTGFNGEKFRVKGLPERVYNILSLPTLSLNARFIPIVAGQALNNTEQSAVRRRASRLIAALNKKAGTAAGAGAANRLPSTTSWSHDGLYMGEMGVQLDGYKLLVKPGSYASGFDTVELDGVPLPVSSSAVQLPSGSSILRSSSSVLEISHTAAQFTLVNSDHFTNIHSAVLRQSVGDREHVDGLLGQTVHASFHVERTAAFTQHVENDFLLPEGDDVWSTAFEHNQYSI